MKVLWVSAVMMAAAAGLCFYRYLDVLIRCLTQKEDSVLADRLIQRARARVRPYMEKPDYRVFGEQGDRAWHEIVRARERLAAKEERDVN